MNDGKRTEKNVKKESRKDRRQEEIAVNGPWMAKIQCRSEANFQKIAKQAAEPVCIDGSVIPVKVYIFTLETV